MVLAWLMVRATVPATCPWIPAFAGMTEGRSGRDGEAEEALFDGH